MTTANCSSSLNWLATAAAVGAAVLLWGVSIEAVYFDRRLTGGFLLANAAIVSALEGATVICLVMRTRGCTCWYHFCCHQFERVTNALDSYRRAVVYALLTVPCFVQLDKYWLPAVPGAALILAALLYALKHCCNRRLPYDFGKMPTFVRFEEDPCFLNPEVLPIPASQSLAVSGVTGGGGSANIYQPACWPNGILDLSAEASSSNAGSQQRAQTQPTVKIFNADVDAEGAPAPPPRRRQMNQKLRAQQQPDKRQLVGGEEDAQNLCGK